MSTVDRVLRALRHGPLTARDLADRLEIPSSTINTRIKHAILAGRINYSPRGRGRVSVYRLP